MTHYDDVGTEAKPKAILCKDDKESGKVFRHIIRLELFDELEIIWVDKDKAEESIYPLPYLDMTNIFYSGRKSMVMLLEIIKKESV